MDMEVIAAFTFTFATSPFEASMVRTPDTGANVVGGTAAAPT
jgi:hypothetical protein